ncbi:hypothetical protein niasHT_021182 [Heterodera trifolii]|uniref:Uncharacterized protein n=1 Tax=Heterodera trifolii TaxID=157864 RepID=A0ABD2KRX6_9BILA
MNSDEINKILSRCHITRHRMLAASHVTESRPVPLPIPHYMVSPHSADYFDSFADWPPHRNIYVASWTDTSPPFSTMLAACSLRGRPAAEIMLSTSYITVVGGGRCVRSFNTLTRNGPSPTVSSAPLSAHMCLVTFDGGKRLKRRRKRRKT